MSELKLLGAIVVVCTSHEVPRKIATFKHWRATGVEWKVWVAFASTRLGDEEWEALEAGYRWEDGVVTHWKYDPRETESTALSRRLEVEVPEDEIAIYAARRRSQAVELDWRTDLPLPDDSPPLAFATSRTSYPLSCDRCGDNAPRRPDGLWQVLDALFEAGMTEVPLPMLRAAYVRYDATRAKDE